MANEKMDLIRHMALLRNIANDVTRIMRSTAAADFIEAAIEIINDYPSDGKLVDTGKRQLTIPDVSVAYELLKEVLQFADGSQMSLPLERIEKFVSEYER